MGIQAPLYWPRRKIPIKRALSTLNVLLWQSYAFRSQPFHEIRPPRARHAEGRLASRRAKSAETENPELVDRDDETPFCGRAPPRARRGNPPGQTGAGPDRMVEAAFSLPG
jgi:hypothetical protein